MIYFQIFYIVIGVLIIIYSVLDYFLQPKSTFFISKRITEYLDENERIKYQKAVAIPIALFGIVVVIGGIFFFDSNIFSKIFWGVYVGHLICTMIINKIHLDYFSPWSIPKKIF